MLRRAPFQDRRPGPRFVLALLGGVLPWAGLAAPPPGLVNLGIPCANAAQAGDQVACFVREDADGFTDLNGDGDTDDFVLHVHDRATGQTTNRGLEGLLLVLGDGLAVTEVFESSQQGDLDGDGDLNDRVLHVHDAAAGLTTNLGLVAGVLPQIHEGFVVFGADEPQQGADLNGDGDLDDQILHVYEAATGSTRNVGLNAFGFEAASGLVAFEVRESYQGGLDLNGDGDASDDVLHVHDLASGTTRNLGIDCASSPELDGARVLCSVDEEGIDLNGDGDALDSVLHVHDLASGTTRNLGIAAFSPRLLEGGVVVFEVSESDRDLNGDGDQDDAVLHVHALEGGRTRNLRIACRGYFAAGRLVACGVQERQQGRDLNGDGDQDDEVLHVHDTRTHVTRNLRLANRLFVWRTGIAGRLVAFTVDETQQSRDLNGDGDELDFEVLHLYDADTGITRNLRLALPGDPGVAESPPFGIQGRRLLFQVSEVRQLVDANGDGDVADRVLYVHDAAAARTRNLELAAVGLLEGDRLAVLLSEEGQGATDLNGDGDFFDPVLHVHDLTDGDEDGLPDADETALGLDPADPDSDQDGVPDGDEVALGSDPADRDADADGIADGSDPDLLAPSLARLAQSWLGLFGDGDDDGLSDGAENWFGTDPADPDSDDDGIPDASDPGTIALFLASFDDSIFRKGSSRYRDLLLGALARVEGRIQAGDEVGAIRRLRSLRRRMDGCRGLPFEEGSGDWIRSCSAQRYLRTPVDHVIGRLAERLFVDGVAEAGREVAGGRRAGAVGVLARLRARTDGCDGRTTETPDRADWVLDCGEQREIRSLLDLLLGNLRRRG